MFSKKRKADAIVDSQFEASVQGEPVGVDESMSRSGTLPKVDIAASGSNDKNHHLYF